MAGNGTDIFTGGISTETLEAVFRGTASATGERFFFALVENLSRALGTTGAWVSEFVPEKRQLRPLAFWFDGEWIEGYAYDIKGTPCEAVIENAQLIHIPDRILDLYETDTDLEKFGAVSYMGVPLEDSEGNILGHLAVLDSRPMPADPRTVSVFRIFAARAAAEFERLEMEAAVRDSEARLRSLVDGAMDAILEFDAGKRLTLANPAAEKLLGRAARELIGKPCAAFLPPESCEVLERHVHALEHFPPGQRQVWIAGRLQITPVRGEPVTVEGTLSRSDRHSAQFYTVILRNVNDRIEAERRIQALAAETEYLRAELDAIQGAGDILGDSPQIQAMLRDIQQVAATGATVLILGETGTGKELVARSIHKNSERAEKPLIKVNCAAIPATLIESEFFGHEKGAFTGATQRREGRFALADKGTLFLDEVGELPLELQAKLLRVLQEGEFEPVGGTRTRKVDVRVIAATNRDLAEMVQEGTFREDLFYRLNVFPVRVPPLRDRGNDVVLLAETFAAEVANRLRRKVCPLGPAAIQRLTAYTWPGNVRELQNVVERAVITSENGALNLARALPDISETPDNSGEIDPGRVWTAAEMQQFERKNIERALQACGWKVAGNEGAAALLGLSPSTLSSRMKSLGISRPAGAVSAR